VRFEAKIRPSSWFMFFLIAINFFYFPLQAFYGIFAIAL
jgi:hypothetical protein